jgi:hypothetical protein
MRRFVFALFLACAVPSISDAQTTYLARHAMAQDAELRTRVQMAIVTAAVQISAEGTGVAFHSIRLSLAQQVIQDPAMMTNRFMLPLVSDGVDYTAATDAVLQTRINAIWNAIAGAVA